MLQRCQGLNGWPPLVIRKARYCSLEGCDCSNTRGVIEEDLRNIILLCRPSFPHVHRWRENFFFRVSTVCHQWPPEEGAAEHSATLATVIMGIKFVFKIQCWFLWVEQQGELQDVWLLTALSVVLSGKGAPFPPCDPHAVYPQLCWGFHSCRYRDASGYTENLD